MIITIDVGNSNVTLGAFRVEELLFLSRLGTNHKSTSDEYAVKIKGILSLHGYAGEAVEGAIISSVVPPLSTTLKTALGLICSARILTVGPGLKTGLNIKIDNPGQLGSDLVCVSVAAAAKYTMPSIVIDMGTATTISALTREGQMIGGAIIPGVQISIEALASRTAQLQQVNLEDPMNSVIGSNTIDCMRAGVLYGNASMLDGMIQKYRKALGNDLTVIATGGQSRSIIPYCEEQIVYDENLLLDGLRLIYEKNQK